MSSLQSLDAQAAARKEKLGQYRNLKRKQADTLDSQTETESVDEEAPIKNLALSGRNYDIQTGAPKLGFDTAPSENQETLEQKAAEIAQETRKIKEQEELNEKAIDLFSLQPKKPNWDLKRDVDKKLEKLEARTNSAIARLVRERILASKGPTTDKAANGGNGDGIEGDFAEMVKRREKEDQEEAMDDDE